MNMKKSDYRFTASISRYEKTFFLSRDIVKKIINFVAISNRRRLRLNIEEFIDVGYLKYLLTVLNSNEQYMIEFKEMENAYFSKEDLEEIIKEQMLLLHIEGKPCFENVSIQRKGSCLCLYEIMCSKDFYMMCRRYSEYIDISCLG